MSAPGPVAGIAEIRGAAKYPSWPAPVRELRCECGLTLELAKSGRGELASARSIMLAHLRGWDWDLRYRVGRFALRFDPPVGEKHGINHDARMAALARFRKWARGLKSDEELERSRSRTVKKKSQAKACATKRTSPAEAGASRKRSRRGKR